MTTSPLVGRKLSTNKSSSRRGNKPEMVIFHHTAGGGNAVAIRMLSGTLGPNDKKVSSHYINLTTGELVGSVDEERRAWTTGWAADKSAITVETVNTSGAPTWAVSDQQLENMSQLAADLSIRYNWGTLGRHNVRGHREFGSTACPGPYIWPRMDSIIARANQIREARIGKPADPQPAPPQDTPSDSQVPDSLAELSQLIDRIVRGDLGNGAERIAKLKSMGFDDTQIASVKTEVDRRVASLRNPRPTVASTPSNTTGALVYVDKIVKKIINGDYGNGADRVKNLKASGFNQEQIDSLQAEVNRRMRRR